VVIGFGFLITLVGVAFMAVELRRSGSTAVGLEMSMNTSELEVAVSQLAKNYDILRDQATQGFMLAAFFMVLGICVILAGAVGDLFLRSRNKVAISRPLPGS
jgi:MFS family permease